MGTFLISPLGGKKGTCLVRRVPFFYEMRNVPIF
jgi:hypothetical protein